MKRIKALRPDVSNIVDVGRLVGVVGRRAMYPIVEIDL
jgi:hypothetical protein